MKIKEISEEEITFDNGYILKYYHEQDCCESVYAEFEKIKEYNLSTVTGKSINIMDIDFYESLDELIQGVPNMGFNMVSKIGEKFFIPCYNCQNGYYSSNLELILSKTQTYENMDISMYVEDNIY